MKSIAVKLIAATLLAIAAVSVPAIGWALDSTPDDVVQQQIEAYNKRDIDAFLATYSDDVALVNFPGKVLYTGKTEMRARYAKMFRESPELNCEITSKMILGNTVIYQERVTGRVGGPIEVLAIYSVADGKITRVEFIRQ